MNFLIFITYLVGLVLVFAGVLVPSILAIKIYLSIVTVGSFINFAGGDR